MNDQQIGDYIFLAHEAARGDVAICFGTASARREAAGRAAELYLAGRTPQLLFTGGVNRLTGTVEATDLAEEAMRLGVPASAILIEDRSASTLENVRFGIEILEAAGLLKDLRSVVAVVKNYHARRALMTLRRHLPMHVALSAAPYDSPAYDFTRTDWSLSPRGRELVLGEMDKIWRYLAEGHLAELP
jgi:uncharacterized SAM-binding protein YcdF (DUF218 family)